jgi:type II secretory pathway pseudopilin PulG
MAALLVGMAIMAIVLSMALPAWKTAAQREKETELIFRGQQYARAVALFQRKYANAFPPNVDVLLNEHFLRKKYKDPMTEDGEFQVLYANQQASAQPGIGIVPTQGQPGRSATGLGNLAQQQQQQGRGASPGGNAVGPQGGIIGVASKSTADSLRIYNGHTKYNEWVFVATQVSNRAGAPTGSQTPTGGINLPGGLPGAVGGRGGRDGRGGQQPGGFPPGQGPGDRGRGNQPQGPFRPGGPGQGGFGAPPGGAPGGIFVPPGGRTGR